MTSPKQTSLERNAALRARMLAVMTGAARPISAQKLTELIDEQYPEFSRADSKLMFVICTNLGYLRTEGKVQKRAFRTGRNMNFGFRTVQETVSLWFVKSQFDGPALNKFQEEFIVEMNALRKERSNARKVHQSE